MRILHVVPSFGFGGMEKIVCAVIDANTNHRHAILALDGHVRAMEWIKNTNVEILPFAKMVSYPSFLRALFIALYAARPSLLMTYNWGSTDAIWLGRLARIQNIIHNEHGFNIDESIGTILRRDLIRFAVYRLASKVVVVSHELERMVHRRFLISRRKIRRISNGIDVSLCVSDSDERCRVRRSLGFADADVVIGFSGRLDPVKNLDLLLDIFSGCGPHNYPFRLLIVGNGSERQHLETRCQAEGFYPYVRFVGEQTEVLPYLRAMDVFLLTSLREQMPLTVLEAMAVGMPVIATRVGELPYIIDDGANGFIRDLTAPVEHFLQPLRSLLCSAQRRRMGNAARTKVIEHFQLTAMLRNYGDLIRQFDYRGG